MKTQKCAQCFYNCYYKLYALLLSYQMLCGTYFNLGHRSGHVTALLHVKSEGDGCSSDPKLPLTCSPHLCTLPFEVV